MSQAVNDPSLAYTTIPNIKNLNLYSLYCRRECDDLIETFKILNQHLLIDSTKWFTLSPINFTRGHNFKLSKPRSNLHASQKKFFTDRIINQWNSLPSDVINAQSVNDFRNRLDMLWTQTGYGHNERPMAYTLQY